MEYNKEMPWYERYLMEFLTTKHMFKDSKEIDMGESVSNVLQRRLSPRCKEVLNGLLAQMEDHLILGNTFGE